MRFLFSNLVIKLLIGAAVVVTVVGIYEASPNDQSCSVVSNMPNRSIVYSCPPGLAALSLRNAGRTVYTQVTTNVRAEAWLTAVGDGETAKTIEKNLGPAVVVGPGAFLAVDTGEGLVYIKSATKFLVTVIRDVNAPHN